MFSLLFGGFFVPFQAKASIFSNLFGNDVLASTDSSTQNSAGINSQNIELLQSNVSGATIIQDKNDANGIDKTKDVSIVSDNALLPAASSAGVLNGTDEEGASSDISVYVVRPKDDIKTIAQMFKVSVNTIYWANDMKKGDKLVVGDTLIILPIDGVQVTVAKGNTLQSLAKKYNIGDPTDIALYNGIPEDTKLTIGDELIIPNGIVNDEGGNTPIKNSNKGSKKYYDTNLAKTTGYFMNPVPGATLTQGLHDGYAVDLAISKGTPIFAAAAGTVIFAKAGWNGAYGNLVIINHSNGTETLYAHQSRIATHVGDDVSQGEVIGYVGSTGHSTGPHLHFEVRHAQNPGASIHVGSIVGANWKY